MKIAIFMSFIVLAVARPQWYSSHPTSGPVYYKPINQNLFYPKYLQGQFRPARSEEAAPAAAAPAVETASVPETARSDEGIVETPVAAPVAPAAPVAAAETARSDEGAPAAPAPEAPAAPVAPVEARAAPASAYKPVEYSGPAAYSYEWLVKDDYTRNDYGQKESRAGANTEGSYHVALPDGRVQTVTYRVDGYGGYVADVSFSGEAQYPDEPAYKPAAKAYKPAPAPAYKPAPAPAYKPAPAPVYKPKPAPVYKPKPAPVYHAHPAPSYPIQPAASVRRYSFRTVADTPVPKEVVAEEARSAAGIEVEVLLDEEPLAPVEVPETARSEEGNVVVIEDIPAVAPVEIVLEETSRSAEGNIVQISEEPVEEIFEGAESKIEVAPVVVEEQLEAREEKALNEVVAEEIVEVSPAEEEIFEAAESKINVVIEEEPEAREAKALADEQVEEVYEAPEAKAAAPVVEEAPLNYRYYYRY